MRTPGWQIAFKAMDIGLGGREEERGEETRDLLPRIKP